jgi:hypothetical protein
MTRQRRSERGSVLLPTFLLVMAITLMAVGFVRFASREVSGASAGRKQAALVACADAGRQRLLAQFHAAGTGPVDLSPLNVPLATETTVRGGHLGGVSVQQVVLGDGRESPRVAKMGDITNVLPGGGANFAPPFRVTVHCDDHGRKLEVEFGVRFGL